MNRLLQDLRYAVRQLRKTPAFTVRGTRVLVLGIASTIGIFTVVDPIPALRYQ
jgi:hypothetical protein